MELYGRIKPCTAACAPSSIVQRSIAETISLKSNFSVVWEARYGIEETRLIWSKQSASNLWRPYANLYTLCVLWWSPIDGKLYHFYFLFSSSSYRYIYCAVFIAIPFCPSFPSCTIVENWIIKFGIWIRGRKHSIWYMRVW